MYGEKNTWAPRQVIDWKQAIKQAPPVVPIAVPVFTPAATSVPAPAFVPETRPIKIIVQKPKTSWTQTLKKQYTAYRSATQEWSSRLSPKQFAVVAGALAFFFNHSFSRCFVLPKITW